MNPCMTGWDNGRGGGAFGGGGRGGGVRPYRKTFQSSVPMMTARMRPMILWRAMLRSSAASAMILYRTPATTSQAPIASQWRIWSEWSATWWESSSSSDVRWARSRRRVRVSLCIRPRGWGAGASIHRAYCEPTTSHASLHNTSMVVTDSFFSPSHTLSPLPPGGLYFNFKSF